MLPPGLRWSLSDILLAIQVIHKVSHAIRNADRADQQYSASIAFLDAFARTIERIKKYIESDKDEIVQHGEDLMVQMTLILTEYTKFDDYLKKCESGLSSMSFVKRITAQTRLALEEVNQKVTDLKKAVLSPMMFITPLLAVETLQQLKAIRANLPSLSSQEASIRENRLMIIRINENLARLDSLFESNWWFRSRAMTAVESDVKSLTDAVQNNQDLLDWCKTELKETVHEEVSKTRTEQALANVATISAIERAMEAKLAHMEANIDVLISQYRSRTGKEDQELHKLKQRVSTSRKHLQEAASNARKCLKHFGLLVKAVDSMHSNPVTRWMLPLANGIIGYDRILAEGENLAKSAGKTITASGKYIQESSVLQNLKSWKPFGPGLTATKEADQDTPKIMKNAHLRTKSAPNLLDGDRFDTVSGFPSIAPTIVRSSPSHGTGRWPLQTTPMAIEDKKLNATSFISGVHLPRSIVRASTTTSTSISPTVRAQSDGCVWNERQSHDTASGLIPTSIASMTKREAASTIVSVDLIDLIDLNPWAD